MSFTHTKAAIAALILAGALVSSVPAAAKAAPGTPKCGDTLTHSVRLTADLTDCLADGLVIGAAGIIVDLNGHTIDGTVTQATDCDVATAPAAGISAGGYDGLTIKNGTIQQFAAGFNAGSDTEGMADSTLHDLTVRDNRFGGITLGSGQPLNNDNRIVGNDVYGNGCLDGITLNNGRGNVVAHNRSHDNGGGITICCSDNNVVRDNEVLDNANNGIAVLFGAHGTVVRENHVARNSNDIVVFEASGNSITRNRATDAVVCADCGLPTGYGIGIAGGSDGNVVSGNSVARTQQDGIRIIDLDPADSANPVPNRTQVRGNIVRGAGADGILVDAAANGTVLERNYAFGAGDDGIHVDSAASALTGNRAFFNHDLGIDAVPGVTDG
jgi:parallel beta-helix repeat protein